MNRSPEETKRLSTLPNVRAVQRRVGALPARSAVFCSAGGAEKKKADVAEHPQVFDHVGLLVNGRLEAELPLT
jgi:hypothetical protein